jgi:Na+-transporting methylmalonyl-CoA/oxaloacetate decarboxylase gamma subunit
MYGLEAINAANGWSMAIVGILIVFTGLSLLSFVISQLHKFLPSVEKTVETEVRPQIKPVIVDKCPTDLKVQTALFEPIVEELGSNFPLTALYAQAKEYNIPHPHLSISALREATILVPLGDGIFSWDKERLTIVCKKAD